MPEMPTAPRLDFDEVASDARAKNKSETKAAAEAATRIASGVRTTHFDKRGGKGKDTTNTHVPKEITGAQDSAQAMAGQAVAGGTKYYLLATLSTLFLCTTAESEQYARPFSHFYDGVNHFNHVDTVLGDCTERTPYAHHNHHHHYHTGWTSYHYDHCNHYKGNLSSKASYISSSTINADYIEVSSALLPSGLVGGADRPATDGSPLQ